MPVAVTLRSSGAVAPVKPSHFPEALGNPFTPGFTANTTAGSALNHSINLPGDVMEDDLLIALVAVDGGDQVASWGGGFQQLAQFDQGSATQAVAWKRADGGEGGGSISITLTAADGIAAQVWKITNAEVDLAPQVSSPVSGVAIEAVPPALTGLVPNRYAYLHAVANDTSNGTTFPSNMTVHADNATNGSENKQRSDFLKPAEGSAGFTQGQAYGFTNSRAHVIYTLAIAANPNGGYVEHPVTVVNPGAEVDTSGWTATLGALGRRTSNPVPFAGAAYFFGGTDAQTTAYQDIAIPASLHGVADAGRLRGRLAWWQNSFASSDDGEMWIEWYDEGSPEAQLGTTVKAGLIAPTVWTQRKLWAVAPPGARVMRIVMNMERDAGTNNDAYIDAISAAFQDHTLVQGTGSP